MTGAGTASAAEPTVTIADPAGPVVIDSDSFAHWRDLAHRAQEGLRDRALDESVLSFLISSSWIVSEALQRNVLPSDADVDRLFHQQKATAFKTEAGYRRFLQQTGYVESDLRFRIKVQESSSRVREQVLAPVTIRPEAIEAYVRRHRDKLRVDERRDVVLVATRSRARALRALAALHAGHSFAAVAHKYSVDASAADAGVLARQEPFDFPSRLAERVFATSRGRLVGPVHAGGRWYVFRVLRVYPDHPMPPALARRTARGVLVAEAQQDALDAFIKGFRATWRARTTCAAQYTWLTEYCGNAGGR